MPLNLNFVRFVTMRSMSQVLVYGWEGITWPVTESILSAIPAYLCACLTSLQQYQMIYGTSDPNLTTPHTH